MRFRLLAFFGVGRCWTRISQENHVWRAYPSVDLLMGKYAVQHFSFPSASILPNSVGHFVPY